MTVACARLFFAFHAVLVYKERMKDDLLRGVKRTLRRVDIPQTRLCTQSAPAT